MNPKDARDTSGVKNISVFISELGERLSSNVLPYISLLLPHLSGESYMMRNGIVQMLGFLVAKGFQENSKNDSREDLLNILEERYLDMNSWTRGKVLQTWQYLFQ
jgi:condensin complex subunit 1